MGDDIEVQAQFDRGEWSVIFKRSMKSASGISFEPSQYVPVAVSVWDGFHRERGNKRSLSAWFHLYVKPAEEVSPVGPMMRAAIGALLVELVLIFFLWRRYGARAATTGAGTREAVPATK